jgi:hypothetical protein
MGTRVLRVDLDDVWVFEDGFPKLRLGEVLVTSLEMLSLWASGKREQPVTTISAAKPTRIQTRIDSDPTAATSEMRFMSLTVYALAYQPSRHERTERRQNPRRCPRLDEAAAPGERRRSRRFARWTSRQAACPVEDKVSGVG